jgi:hypothetical protein
MDINPFEVAGKTIRRSVETVLDTYNYAQSTVWHWLPAKPFNSYKEESSEEIMRAAKMSLRHGDLSEASDQLNRELYFCSLVDDLAGSKNEVAARAGLDAIKQGQPSEVVSATLEQTAINTIKDRFEKDLVSMSSEYRSLAQRVRLDTVIHVPRLGYDADNLAQFDAAYAEFKLDHSQPADGWFGPYTFTRKARDRSYSSSAD